MYTRTRMYELGRTSASLRLRVASRTPPSTVNAYLSLRAKPSVFETDSRALFNGVALHVYCDCAIECMVGTNPYARLAP
ncbi:hypothetical protein MLPF_3128 [Mycobacterium lepromatosis]|nr:hypothetical protein MLPF_3128 [Mycobacterium lepromatosis]